MASRIIGPMYLDEDTLAWAQATGEGEEDETKVIHRDSNGNSGTGTQ
jgi:protein PhnA